MRIKKNAFFNRNLRNIGFVVVALGCVPVTANAFYNNLVPPSGYSTNAAAQAIYKAAESERWVSNAIRTTAGASIAGRAVSVPVGMRLAANTGRFMAAALTINPLWLAAGAIGFAAYNQWLSDSNLEFDGTNFKRRSNTISELWTFENGPGLSYSSRTAACKGGGGNSGAVTSLWSGVAGEPGERWGCEGFGSALHVSNTQNPNIPQVVTPKEAEDDLAKTPFPDEVPNVFPQPLPVDQPVINPSPALEPQPMRVPLGEPSPVVNTTPQQYKQPVADIVPAPTSTNPWQVDIQPKDITSTSPSGVKDPVTPPAVPASGTSATPSEKTDLCLEHPDILACAKPDLDTPDGTIPKVEKSIQYHEESIWGSGSCPSDKTVTLHTGQTLKVWDFQQTCQYINSGVAPIFLACSVYSAFLILALGAKDGV